MKKRNEHEGLPIELIEDNVVVKIFSRGLHRVISGIATATGVGVIGVGIFGVLLRARGFSDIAGAVLMCGAGMAVTVKGFWLFSATETLRVGFREAASVVEVCGMRTVRRVPVDVNVTVSAVEARGAKSGRVYAIVVATSQATLETQRDLTRTEAMAVEAGMRKALQELRSRL